MIFVGVCNSQYSYHIVVGYLRWLKKRPLNLNQAIYQNQLLVNAGILYLTDMCILGSHHFYDYQRSFWQVNAIKNNTSWKFMPSIEINITPENKNNISFSFLPRYIYPVPEVDYILYSMIIFDIEIFMYILTLTCLIN